MSSRNKWLKALTDRHSSVVTLQRDLFLCMQNLGRQAAIDVGDDRDYFQVGQDATIAGHVADISWRRRPSWNKAILHHIDQHLIRVVPGMASLVVRRCRQLSIGHAFAPSRLALQRLAMARRAIIRVDGFALHY